MLEAIPDARDGQLTFGFTISNERVPGAPLTLPEYNSTSEWSFIRCPACECLAGTWHHNYQHTVIVG